MRVCLVIVSQIRLLAGVTASVLTQVSSFSWDQVRWLPDITQELLWSSTLTFWKMNFNVVLFTLLTSPHTQQQQIIWWFPPLPLTGHGTKQPLHHSPGPQQVQITCPWWDDHQTHSGGKVRWMLLYTEWNTEASGWYVVYSLNYCSACPGLSICLFPASLHILPSGGEKCLQLLIWYLSESD